jgi:hypothetical protein
MFFVPLCQDLCRDRHRQRQRNSVILEGSSERKEIQEIIPGRKFREIFQEESSEDDNFRKKLREGSSGGYTVVGKGKREVGGRRVHGVVP